MSKKIILHIGSNKTGTTYLQNALDNNRAELESQGFNYPGDDYCHHYLYSVAQRPEKNWPRIFRMEAPADLEKKVEQHLTAVTRDLQKEVDSFLISNEFFFFSDGESVDRTVDFFSRFADRVEVVVFVRQPSEHYASYQQQVVKGSHRLQRPDEYIYPFREVIASWSERVGQMHVRKYDRDTDPVGELANIAGFESSRLKIPQQRINESMHLEQMWVLQKLQSTFYRDYADRFKPHLSSIAQLRPSGLTRPRLRPAVGNLVDARHREDLDWLHKHYGVDFGDGVPGTSDGEAVVVPEEPGVFDLFDGREAIPEVYESWLIDTLLKQRAN